MTARLANRLDQLRRRRFVGRESELELFRTALVAEVPEFVFLYLYGPGGVGKSSILREFVSIAELEQYTVLFLDCRNLDLSPVGFWSGVQNGLHLPAGHPPQQAIANLTRFVLFLDAYELAAPLENWLREEFFPLLSEQVIVVIACRNPPNAAWRAGEWSDLTRTISLRNLLPNESASFLKNQELPEQAIEQILGVTYGHPLALSLAADLFRQNQAFALFDLKQDPHILRLLLERFVADVPSPFLRQALEICAHAYNTDEVLLAACLGEEMGYEAFQWLRSLSFIEQGPWGLFPHDLAREVLEADLRWRNLTRFREVHTQVRNHIIQRIRESDGAAQQYAIFALLFLHRNNPFMRAFYEWQSMGQLYIDSARPGDIPLIERAILRHQGEESLAMARYWREQSTSVWYVFRGAGGAIAGFCYLVDISHLRDEDRIADPAMRAVSEYLQEVVVGKQPGTILYFRDWLDLANYQDSPSIFNMCAMVALRYYFNAPDLAYTFIAQTNHVAYEQMFAYLRTPLAPKACFYVDNQEIGVFAHDWRAEPVLEWLEMMGERELLDEIVALDTLPQDAYALVLSEPEFGEAVRQALKEIRRPHLLAQNPLLRSRCLQEYGAQPPTPASLQSLLDEGLEILAANPKTQKLYRVLWHTYFDPAPTQEIAAELLDLPFSTYRYQLGKGIDDLVQWLWQREVYGIEQTSPKVRH